MATITPKGLILLLGAALVAVPNMSWGQKPATWPVKLCVYRMVDGLPESSCISVALAPQGRVLVRHLNAASVSLFDGYAVTTIPAPQSGNGRVYESPGGQLWTVVAEGLQEFRNGNWELHPVTEIAAEFQARLPRLIDPIPLCPVRQGVVLFLLPDRLLEFSAEDPEHPRIEVMLTAAQTRLEKFSGMTLTRDGTLWIAGMRGLSKSPGSVRNLKRDGEWHDYLPPESLQIHNLQELHGDEEGVVTAVAESAINQQKALVHFDGKLWTAEVVPIEKARYAWRGPDKTDWASTVNSVYEWEPSGKEAGEIEEGSVRQLFDMAVEPGGAFWLATSDGLLRYAPFTWRSPAPVRRISSLARCITGDEAGRLWFVSGSSLHSVQNDQHQEFPLPLASPNNSSTARAVYPLKNGSLLLDAGDQCFLFSPDTAAFKAVMG
ncbi:MAG: hypothetical protein NT154_27975, partial [Verrucomicrobia bacterium]|nr:hypothetical protein [Verrucomicrobiota bacterium]